MASRTTPPAAAPPAIAPTLVRDSVVVIDTGTSVDVDEGDDDDDDFDVGAALSEAIEVAGSSRGVGA